MRSNGKSTRSTEINASIDIIILTSCMYRFQQLEGACPYKPCHRICALQDRTTIYCNAHAQQNELLVMVDTKINGCMICYISKPTGGSFVIILISET